MACSGCQATRRVINAVTQAIAGRSVFVVSPPSQPHASVQVANPRQPAQQQASGWPTRK